MTRLAQSQSAKIRDARSNKASAGTFLFTDAEVAAYAELGVVLRRIQNRIAVERANQSIYDQPHSAKEHQIRPL